MTCTWHMCCAGAIIGSIICTVAALLLLQQLLAASLLRQLTVGFGVAAATAYELAAHDAAAGTFWQCCCQDR